MCNNDHRIRAPNNITETVILEDDWMKQMFCSGSYVSDADELGPFEAKKVQGYDIHWFSNGFILGHGIPTL